MTDAPILTTELSAQLAKAIAAAGGWLAFDDFMALALYTPGLGYYSRDAHQFGLMPHGVRTAQGPGGGDFVTAPELSAHFGQTLARQVAQALAVSGTNEVWEFGAGSGALALQILQALPHLQRYTIVDVSGSLRQRQQETLAGFADKVHWADALPNAMQGVVLGNEVLDAMPVKLLARVGRVWHERGVVLHGGALVHADMPTNLRPPCEVPGQHDYLTEIHPQAEAFIRTLADRLRSGAIFLLDYGFPEHEYYHPQRSMGTVMCHRHHLADGNALVDVGDKDITAHVNFTGIALAGQDAGLNVLGYTSQGRFLLNCGLLDSLHDASVAERSMAQKLVHEHEMGELFKVIAFGAAQDGAWQPLGFAQADRSHTL